MDGGVASSSLEGSSDATAEVSAAKAAAPSVQPAPAAAEGHGLDGGAAADDAAPAMTDLLEGTDAPAQDSSPVTAAAVAMPSAEMLQAASDGGKSAVADNGDANSVAEVAKVIADALAGGEGAGHHGDIDALLQGLPGGEHGAQVAMEALATQPGADVPAWDMGGAGAFAQHAAMSMDAAAMHQDAAVQHA
jgi:hypothetical protein